MDLIKRFLQWNMERRLAGNIKQATRILYRFHKVKYYKETEVVIYHKE